LQPVDKWGLETPWKGLKGVARGGEEEKKMEKKERTDFFFVR
jgi:hypothetical protein